MGRVSMFFVPRKESPPSSTDSSVPPQFPNTSTGGDMPVSEDTMILVEAIQMKLSGAGKEAIASKRTIFQVPNHICRGREQLFRPQIVSIGPYARENDGQPIKKEFLAMEVVKKQLLQDLIKQASNRFLTACVQKLKELESEIRLCYYQSFEEMKSDVFVETMLLDGIFIIQYFMKWKRQDIYSTVGCVQWNFGMIMHDLLLLENQIPFFVLQALFDLFVSHRIGNPSSTSNTCSSSNNPKLLEEILGVLKSQDELLESGETIHSGVKIKHLLHLYHHCYVSKKINHVPGGIDHAPGSILSATKLQEAGIKFKKKKKSTGFLDVTFKNGILEIPRISIDDRTTYKFANLISLEQSTSDVPHIMTSYAVFMDEIIDTAKDVEILQYEGILENMFPSNEEVALFFNQLCRYVHLDVKKHYLAPVFRDVDAYCKSKWHEQRAWLVRNYFSNPWVFISLMAAVILLILAFLQAYFSVFAYFHPPSTS